MEIVLVLLVLCFLLFVVLAVRTARAVKRGVERAGVEARRSLSQAGLAARAAQPGPVGELARTRKELRTSIDSTRAVLERGSAEDPALREALGLLDQLHGHARHLDQEMGALMAAEPDRRRVTQRLPHLRERADRIRKSADALRHAAQERAHRYDTDELDSLHQQIGIEASALRHWAPAEPTAGPSLPPEPEKRQLFRKDGPGAG
ncbi:hypothetical protein PJ985_11530 [Streptomyces sp. ACA25]|uniref:hypothetical protein n=1 Tax=Streptomyces sp. ACA25 TaxID=3022596 RepID=UPI002306DF3A|nr:hypothetical protein [Streptomyces sp. ACA25]MDB1088193.1 hypothetical protein [Streptomyces sp. ACA25]